MAAGTYAPRQEFHAGSVAPRPDPLPAGERGQQLRHCRTGSSSRDQFNSRRGPFSKNRSFFARYAPAILVAIGLLTPVMIYAAYRTIQSNTNKVQDWLPATFVETGDLAWFRRHFAGDQFVIISWDGCRLGGNPSQPNAEPDDPRIEQFAQALAPEFNLLSADRSPPPSGEAPPHKHYFKSVTTPRQLLTFLTSPPMDVPYDIAVRRLQGLLIGPDGHQASLVVTLTDEAVNNFRGVLGRGDGGWLRFHRKPGVLFELLRKCHIDTATVHLGGPPVDNVSIDEEGERTLVRLAFLSGLLGLILSWWSLRSIKLTLIVFACGLLSAAASLAAVWLTGETADAILMSMPSLIYVLGISGAVHLINYYRDEVTERGYAGAPNGHSGTAGNRRFCARSPRRSDCCRCARAT